ncbi:MAG: nucleoside 2-deoxyribosyltransferase [Prevotella sp.]
MEYTDSSTMQQVYFSGSIRGGRLDASLYNRIIAYINRNARVLTEHIGVDNLNLKEQGDADKVIYKRDILWLCRSDIVIAECTSPSLGVGYELAYAESIGKPCHIFYNAMRTQLSAMLLGNDYFNIHPYHKEADIHPVLDKILGND